MHTLSEENYLKAIYHIAISGNNKISPTAIANAMNIYPPSVIDMLKKLGDKKLIQYEKSKGVKLTENGRKTALSVIRNHRLWEVFLLNNLGYKWDEVHPIAEQLEHINFPGLADRLDKFLGYPSYDPHGDPIPKSDGEMPELPSTLLWNVEDGKACRVAGVKDSSASFLHYLQKLSIEIGTKITLIDRNEYDNSVNLLISNETRVTVSKKFAENILVDYIA